MLAAIHNTPVVEVPRGEDFALPEPTELAQSWHAAGVKLGFVVNPHAPSGRLESLDALRELAGAFEGLLLVDEAYVDFASSRCSGPAAKRRAKERADPAES